MQVVSYEGFRLKPGEGGAWIGKRWPANRPRRPGARIRKPVRQLDTRVEYTLPPRNEVMAYEWKIKGRVTIRGAGIF